MLQIGPALKKGFFYKMLLSAHIKIGKVSRTRDFFYCCETMLEAHFENGGSPIFFVITYLLCILLDFLKIIRKRGEKTNNNKNWWWMQGLGGKGWEKWF